MRALEVLHVIESGYEAGVRETLICQGRKLLVEARATAEKRDVQCAVTLEDAEQHVGDVSSAISRALERARHLVLGTHGRTNVDTLAYGKRGGEARTKRLNASVACENRRRCLMGQTVERVRHTSAPSGKAAWKRQRYLRVLDEAGPRRSIHFYRCRR